MTVSIEKAQQAIIDVFEGKQDIKVLRAQSGVKYSKDIDNVEFIQKDIYTEEWDFPQVNVVMIDAGHTYEHVVHDIQKVMNYFDNPIIIMDDYGNPNVEIKRAIDEAINSGLVTKGPHIGEVSGFKTAAGWVMNDKEGIILNFNKEKK